MSFYRNIVCTLRAITLSPAPTKAPTMATPITPPHSPCSSGPSTPPLPDLPVVEDTEPYDLFGIGFGPTHLALAIAFQEEHPSKRAMFIDTKEAFSW